MGGILNRPVIDADEDAFRRASCALVHRGPDEEGLVVDTRVNAVLAFRRLSIIDLADGHQPMGTGYGHHLVYNGEIYNYRELRQRLTMQGLSFRTASDTEVLLKVLAHDGIDGISPLKGMFAFAFLDVPGHRLLLARDRLGVKPLYFVHTADGFFFASEPKALLALPWIRPELAAEQLVPYFTFRAAPSPATLFRGISRVGAGCALALDLSTHQLSHTRYWSVPSAPANATPRASIKETLDRFEAALLEAVRRRLVADVPVGAFLSGGLDSSLIVAAMRRLGHPDIQTFTATFPGSPDDESLLACETSRRFGSRHTEHAATAADFLGALPRWVELNDDLVADASSLPLLLVSDAARRRRCTVMLSGEGADELFAGYGSYHKFVLLNRAHQWIPPTALRAWMVRCGAGVGVLRAQDLPRVNEYFVRGAPYLGTAAQLARPDLQALLDPSLHDGFFFLPTADGTSLTALCRFDFRVRIPDDLLVRTDRATMGASIEARVPFLDHDLVELVTGLPPHLRSVPGASKLLPRLLALRWGVPVRTVVHRKIGFQLPLGEWIRGPLAGHMRAIIRERAVPGIRYDAVAALHRAHADRRGDFEEILWRVAALEYWYRRWVLGETSAPAASASRARPVAAGVAA